MDAEEVSTEVRRGRPRDLELRAQVLTAASAQLAVMGFAAMTMEGLAADAGIAKRTLYRWWPSKAAVVADAILDGFIPVPINDIRESGDVWADLDLWLRIVAESMRGSYGEVLRASAAISASDTMLGDSLTQAFAGPARANVVARLVSAVRDGQIAGHADLEAVVDLLMAVILFIGVSRADVDRIPAALRIVRSGISTKH